MNFLAVFLILFSATQSLAMGKHQNPDGSFTTWFGAPPSQGGSFPGHPGAPDNPINHGGGGKVPSAPPKPMTQSQAESWGLPRPLTQKEVEEHSSRKELERQIQACKGDFEVYRDLFFRNHQRKQAGLRNSILCGIKDPGFVAHHFKSSGEFREKIQVVYTDLYKATPEAVNEVHPGSFDTEVRKQEARFYRNIGMTVATEADQTYFQGDRPQGEYLKEIALNLLDFTIGLHPLTGFTQSFYELYSGKHFFNGTALSQLDRNFAYVNLATIGAGKYVTRTYKGMQTIYNGAKHLLSSPERQAVLTAMKEGSIAVEKAEELFSNWKRNHQIIAIKEAETVNESLRLMGFDRPPYLSGSHVIQFKTTHPDRFVRVHLENNPTGSWVVRYGEIKGLNAEQIRVKLNLEVTPKWISEVHVPTGTLMSRGMTHFNLWDEKIAKMEGQVQYRIESQWDKSWFKEPKRIGEF